MIEEDAWVKLSDLQAESKRTNEANGEIARLYGLLMEALEGWSATVIREVHKPGADSYDKEQSEIEDIYVEAHLKPPYEKVKI
jgi:hypothetical protein